jgi:dimethylargininase
VNRDLIAFTRAVPQSIVDCELTHLEREPIDIVRASAQHRQYEDALVAAGCTIERLPPSHDLPDSVFVEDTAVVLPEIAVMTRPGACSRRQEVDSVAGALGRYRDLARIEPPATLDGGDVLTIGKTIFVGASGRTNGEGVVQLARIAGRYGYTVRSVEVRGCLHLKSGVSEVAEGTVLVNPAWVDAGAFERFERIEVDPSEPAAANALRIGSSVIFPSAFARTRERLLARGLDVRSVDADELAKAEGGVTCCSIVFRA